MQKRAGKKGAIELSISTIVIIVLAMSMLILGLVLVKSIFTSSIYNVQQINKNVEAQINKLFTDQGGKSFIFLPDNTAEIKKGKSFGVALSVKNELQGISTPSTFKYVVKASSIQTGCKLSLQQADQLIILGGTGSFQLNPGEQLETARIIKIQPNDATPLCEMQYDVVITADNQPYDTNFFIVKVVG